MRNIKVKCEYAKSCFECPLYDCVKCDEPVKKKSVRKAKFIVITPRGARATFNTKRELCEWFERSDYWLDEKMRHAAKNEIIVDGYKIIRL